MKTRRFLTIFFLLIIFIPFSKSMIHADEHFTFVENRGQWDDFIRYKVDLKGGAVFFEQKAITFTFLDNNYLEKIAAFKSGNRNVKLDEKAWIYSYQVQFENANFADISGEDLQEEYYNYYIGDNPEQWQANVPLFHEIIYREIYQGINLRYYTQNHALKYDLIVQPHFEVENIKMQYRGVDKIYLKNGVLELRIGKFSVSELAPYAYQIDKEGNRNKIACNFVLDGNIVSFQVGKYDENLPLIIDPTIIFASYSGSSADNWGYTATYDNAGNLYGGGVVYGTVYPTTLGAYQTFYAGGIGDIAITKFNTNGTARIYSTYLGGAKIECPHSLIVNENDELYVLATTSSSNYPTTVNVFQRTFRQGTRYNLTGKNDYDSGSDIVISRFNSQGTQLLNSTYFGGSGNDGLNTASSLNKNYSDEVRGEIQIDNSGNVYIVSSTFSSNLPTTANVFQPTYRGNQDGIIAKFSYNLENLIWCSYFGGSGDDAIYSMDLDAENNLYIVGGTTSSNLSTSGNAVQSSNYGNVDGFVAKISADGRRILACTYLGTNLYDQAYLIELDKYENVYVMGQTNATAVNWINNVQWSSGQGQFLTKLNNNLSQKLASTSFGSSGQGYNISPTAMMVDICGNIHISGWGGEVNNTIISGMPITTDAFKKTTDAGDFYLITIGRDMRNLVFATYFGGSRSAEHVDGGTSRFDKKGTIYQAVCAGCGRNQDFPVTPTAVARTNGSFNCNLGVVKVEFNLQGVISEFSMPSIICTPYNIVFQNESRVPNPATTAFYWDFGDGYQSREKQPSHTYTQSGTYMVRLIVEDSSSCNIADTLEKQLVVLSNTLDTLPLVSICKGMSAQIGIPPSGEDLHYSWQPNIGLNNTTISNPYFIDTISRFYQLYISNGVCVDTLIQEVQTVTLPKGRKSQEIVCANTAISIMADTSGNANYFHWSSSPQFTDTLNASFNNPYLNLSSLSQLYYYLHRKNANCEAIDTIEILQSRFSIAIDSIPTICYGDSLNVSLKVFFSRNSSSYTNLWQIGKGRCLVDSTGFEVLIKPDTTTNLTIISTNEHGCSNTYSTPINVFKINPQIQTTDIQCYGDASGSIVIDMKDTMNNMYEFDWSPKVSNNDRAFALVKGTYVVKITEQNHKCSIIENIVLEEPDKIQLSLYDTLGEITCAPICGGKGSVAIQGGTAPYNYHWNTGETTLSLKNLCVDTYTFYLSDANNCQDSINFEVRDTSDMQLYCTMQLPTCYGNCDGVLTLLVDSATYPLTIRWNNGDTSMVPSGLCAGNYQVQVIDAVYCRRKLSVNLPTPEKLSAKNHEIIRPSCNGKSDGAIYANISGGTPPYRYYWSGQLGVDSLIGLPSGNYSLNVIDANDCRFDTTFTIIDYDTISIGLSATNIPCEEVCNGIITPHVQGGCPPYAYRWNNGDTASIAKNLCKGNYKVIVEDKNLCSTFAEITIIDSSSFSRPISAWADSVAFYRSLSTTLRATDLGGGFSYEWTPTDGLINPRNSYTKATPTETTLYTVIVRDRWGCEQRDTVLITIWDVICEEPFVFVPNAFSPNGDGVNDILYVRGLLLETIDFKIYDRWGEKIFETDDKNKGWDGTYKGKICEPGVYVYYLQATCLGGIEYLHKGNITLIR